MSDITTYDIAVDILTVFAILIGILILISCGKYMFRLIGYTIQSIAIIFDEPLFYNSELSVLLIPDDNHKLYENIMSRIDNLCKHKLYVKSSQVESVTEEMLRDADIEIVRIDLTSFNHENRSKTDIEIKAGSNMLSERTVNKICEIPNGVYSEAGKTRFVMKVVVIDAPLEELNSPNLLNMERALGLLLRKSNVFAIYNKSHNRYYMEKLCLYNSTYRPLSDYRFGVKLRHLI